jgi:glycolate oxidase
VAQVGGPERPGYDLVALFTGSEGTLGIVTGATLRLLRRPEAVATLLAAYATPAAASRAVSAIIAGGVVPAALEMMDAVVVEALRAAFGFDFPPGAGALLLVEADGPRARVEEEAESLARACRDAGALSVRVARDEAERAELWIARKRAFGALGRIARNYYTQDGVIPRTRLPEMLDRVARIAAAHRVRVANVFHAGDGNLHPCILFDDRDADETRRVMLAGQEILAACVALGGSLTGEHGVGVEKREAMASMFAPADLETMKRLRAAFDPAGLCNPKKIFPTGQGCLEVSPRHRQVAV